MTIPLARQENLGASPVLDIRRTAEFAAGHLPGAMHVELGSLPTRIAEVPNRPLVVMCGHGERAMAASRPLRPAGRCDVTVLAGGADDWAHAIVEQLKYET